VARQRKMAGPWAMGSIDIYYDKHKLYKSFNREAIENISQCN